MSLKSNESFDWEGHSPDEGARSKVSGALNYLTELKKRHRDILTLSILLTVTFIMSPLALTSIFYGVKADKEIKDANYSIANKYMDRAQFMNLAALIIGVLFLLCLILLAGIFISTMNSCR